MEKKRPQRPQEKNQSSQSSQSSQVSQQKLLRENSQRNNLKPMAKTVKLNIAERLYLIPILNGYKGALDTLHHIQDALRAFAFTKEEQEKIEFKTVPSADGKTSNYIWNAEKAQEVEGTLSAEALDYIVDIIKKNDEAKMYGVNDIAVLNLRDKLTLETV